MVRGILSRLVSPISDERTFTIRASRTDVARALDDLLGAEGAQVRSYAQEQVLLTMGSRFLGRMGGAMSSPRWIPLVILITIEEQGPVTQLHVRQADNLGLLMRWGLWPVIVRRRMRQIFRVFDRIEAYLADSPTG